VTRRFVILPAARADLLEQFGYLTQSSLDAASRILAAAETAFERLAEMPGLGVNRPMKDSRLASLRQWPVPGIRNHLIYYRETADGIEVIRVLHGARDVQRILDEETEV
jgi:toxin ParE1/3/4